MDTQPVISIITVCFNSEATIEATLKSVAEQTYPQIEHIIVDGRSTDNTLGIVSRHPHISKIISEKDNGIYDAMNKGLKLATGEIIGVLNSDDFYINNEVIQDVVTQINENGADALYADLVYVSKNDVNKVVRTWHAGNYKSRNFLFGWMPPHPTFFVKRHVYEEYGLFDVKLRSSADYELMLRFLYKYGIKVIYLPKVIIKMRAGGQSNASIFNRIKANKEDIKAWNVNGLKPFFFTGWLKPIRKLTQYFLKPKLNL